MSRGLGVPFVVGVDEVAVPKIEDKESYEELTAKMRPSDPPTYDRH